MKVFRFSYIVQKKLFHLLWFRGVLEIFYLHPRLFILLLQLLLL